MDRDEILARANDYEWHLGQAETSPHRRGVFMAVHLNNALSTALIATGPGPVDGVVAPPAPVLDPEGPLDVAANAEFLDAHRANIAALRAFAETLPAA